MCFSQNPSLWVRGGATQAGSQAGTPSHPQVFSSAWPCQCNIWGRWTAAVVLVVVLGHLGSLTNSWFCSPPLLPIPQPLGLFLSAMAPPVYEGYQTIGHHSFLQLAGSSSQLRETASPLMCLSRAVCITLEKEREGNKTEKQFPLQFKRQLLKFYSFICRGFLIISGIF